MNEDDLRAEIMRLDALPGHKVVCEVPRSYLLNIEMDRFGSPVSIGLRFSVPTIYPKSPPTCAIESHEGIPAPVVRQIEERVAQCYMFLRGQERWITYVAEEVKAIILKQSEKHTSNVHLPDAFEASKLQIQASLSRARIGQWVRERTTSFKKESVSQNSTAIDAFLVYSLFRACKGKLSLEECLNLLVNQLNVIASPGPPVDLIPTIVCQLHEECKTLPPYVEAMMFRSGENLKATTASFFNDYSVIGLCGATTVEARNLVDRRVYAIKVIVMPEGAAIIPPETSQLLQIQHRYIVRYYNAWIDECDEDGSRAISDAFCLAHPVNKPAKFLFMQMDYFEGRTLRQYMKDSAFFQEDTLRQAISWQILEALHYLHSHDVVYNAMSADNIFIERGTAKLGDFCENKAPLQFPYKDPSGVIDSKSDMFAFGIVYFELWYPFSSAEERRETLSRLIASGTVPKEWSKVFPMQATIVKLLMQSPEQRPSAVDLLQSKLIPFHEVPVDESELKHLTQAISQGEITLNYHAPEVLAALFAESRRLPFRLSDFKGAGNADLVRGKFLASAIGQFFNLASGYNGKFIHLPQIHSFTAEDGGILVMSKDGTLHGLYTSISRAYARWLQQNNISSIRLFSKHTIFREGASLSNGEIEERELLSFDIASPKYEITDLLEVLDFTLDFIDAVFAGANVDVKMIHSGLIRELKEIEKRQGEKVDYCSLQRIKELVRTDRDSAAYQYYREVKQVGKHLAARRYSQTRGTSQDPDGGELSVKLARTKRVSGNMLALRVSVHGIDTAVIGVTIHTRLRKGEEATSCCIVSSRVSLQSLCSLFDRKPVYDPKQIEAMIIITGKFRENQDLDEIERPVFPEPVWSKAYVLVQVMATQLRKENIATWIAPNDGKTVKDHLKDANEKSMKQACICYIDESEKVVVRFAPKGSRSAQTIRGILKTMKSVIIDGDTESEDQKRTMREDKKKTKAKDKQKVKAKDKKKIKREDKKRKE